MQKLHFILLKKFIPLFLLLFFIIELLVYHWIYQFYLDSSKKTLAQEIELTAVQIENYCDLENLAHNAKKRLHLHMTILDGDGDILIDSNSKTDENERYAEEILQADKQEFGYKIRHLNATNKEMLIVAKRYTLNGDIFYIRLSRELEGIKSDILVLNIKISIILILFLTLLIYFTYKVKSEISCELEKISLFLTSLTKKKKENYIRSDYSVEFNHMTRLITKIAQIIIKKDKNKAEHTRILEESNRQKDDIISAIAHEFKNPIAIINGYVETLIDDENINKTIQRKFLKKIAKNGTKLSALIDTLRLAMKLESNQESITTSSLNLTQLAHECVENLQEKYKYKKVIFTSDDTVIIQANEGLLSVAITNLVENAFKYSEDEVHIDISKESLSVSDTGIGISPKDLEKITHKFYRINTNTWNNSLGLGLFLVQRVVELHHFKLQVQSVENRGSTFTILF